MDVDPSIYQTPDKNPPVNMDMETPPTSGKRAEPFSYADAARTGARAEAARTGASGNTVARGLANRVSVLQVEPPRPMTQREANAAARVATTLEALAVVKRRMTREEAARAKMNEIVDINIFTSSKKNGSAVPDISWTKEREEEYQGELDYSWNNPNYPWDDKELPTSFFGAAENINEAVIINDHSGIDNSWYNTDKFHPVRADSNNSEYIKNSTYYIDVNSLPAFKSIRGVGGAIYILRYFQFIDMVHDMCHKRGDKSNSWALNIKYVNRAYEKIKQLYIDDIKWLKSKDIKPYVNSTVLSPAEIKRELSIFYAFICLNPKKNNLEFYDLFITINKISGEPEFIKNKAKIPSDSSNTLRVQYLLSIFMNIGEINNATMLSDSIDPSSPCSSFLESNINYILKARRETSFVDNLRKRLNYPRKIILHVDAESNKTGLCGIMPKFCDYATSKESTNVEYTKNFSSKEYDAAFIQQSEVYADLLDSSTHKFQIDLNTSKSADSTSIKLVFGTETLMEFKYERYKIYPYQEEIYVISNSYDKGFLTRKISDKKVSKNGLLYFLYLYDKKFRNKNTPIEELKRTVVTLNPWNNTIRTEIYNKVKKADMEFARNFTKKYKLDYPKTTVGIKLIIKQAYDLNEAKFGIGLKARYNPFSDTGSDLLEANENLSNTSSVRAITYGEHYDDNYNLVNDDSIKNADGTTSFHHRSWFKHIGDFGQALEFYGYTQEDFNARVWPVFVSFDKLSAYLSSMFNPLTCLENLKKDSINKLQFYFKSNRLQTGIVDTTYLDPQNLDGGTSGNFGKVNYMDYNRRMYNKRIYNRRRYNILKRLKLMSHLELKNKLKSVGIKITKNLRGKRKYLTRKELENKALLFNKLQNTAKRMKIKIMYKSRSRIYKRNGMYKYKTYKRLQKEINSKKMKKNKSKNSVVRNFNFG